MTNIPRWPQGDDGHEFTVQTDLTFAWRPARKPAKHEDHEDLGQFT